MPNLLRLRSPFNFCFAVALFLLTAALDPHRSVYASADDKAHAAENDDNKDGTAKSDDNGKKKDSEVEDDKNGELEPVVTQGSVEIEGVDVPYTATAGKMRMKTDEGEVKAEVFFVAYTKDEKRSDGKDNDEANNDDDKDDDENGTTTATDNRPITFCFNGGPGSSSVWLHLGMLGPVRVKLDSDAQTLPPPHELIPNHFSLLDVTDLVFVDPVSTGFSRPAKGEDKRQFHGYDEDVRSVGQFIHDYITKYGRWSSPKFLIGESYGGLRAAALSGELQDRYRIYFNGIVLVSAVVNFQTLSAHSRNDIAYVLFLPSYAATAWYHNALSDDLQNKSLEEVVAEAERFARGPYLRALAAGDSLSDERRERIIKRMAELTGLSTDYIDHANLRVSMSRFGKRLLHDEKKIVGRFDSRYAGIALDPIDDTMEYDPSAAAVFGTFTSAINDYLRTQLNVNEERVYEILTGRVHPWDYSEFTNRYVDASETLRRAMTQNPHLKVFAACGHFDLATPPFAMEYTRDHLLLAPNLRDHFSIAFYEAGHMMYIHEPSLVKLRNDLKKFYKSALPDSDEQ